MPITMIKYAVFYLLVRTLQASGRTGYRNEIADAARAYYLHAHKRNLFFRNDYAKIRIRTIKTEGNFDYVSETFAYVSIYYASCFVGCDFPPGVFISQQHNSSSKSWTIAVRASGVQAQTRPETGYLSF